MTHPTDIAAARSRQTERRAELARVALALPVAGTPWTGALVTGARARVRHGGHAGAIRLIPLRPGPAWPRRIAA